MKAFEFFDHGGQDAAFPGTNLLWEDGAAGGDGV